MGLIKAFTGAISGTFADQWKDIITVDSFDEQTAVLPGIQITNNRGRGSNYKGSIGIISNGSKIYVPENTAAVIFDNSGIQEIVSESGGYEYRQGESSIFARDGIGKSIVEQVVNRTGYGGMPGREIRVCFVNLRELRNIKFGTTSPINYNDSFYNMDLRLTSYGTMSIQIINQERFVREYLPANTDYYSFGDEQTKMQIVNEFMQSFIVALGGLSGDYRISQLPAQTGEMVKKILADEKNAGTWENRFGFRLCNISIKNIELTEDSQNLIDQYNINRVELLPYEGVSKKASDIKAQQNISEGIKEHGFGDGPAGMFLGMDMAKDFFGKNSNGKRELKEQIELVKELKELYDSGVLSKEEFEKKKKEILEL